jgi:hypothetical protein
LQGSWLMGRTMTHRDDDMGASLSVEELQGKQSVRTTFRLPDYTINLLNVVAFQLGLQQKSLFDQLIEDENIVKEIVERAIKHNQQMKAKDRRQKTYVLNRKSLEVIDKLSKELNISRDFLVEVSIYRLLPVLNSEQKKHKNRSIFYEDLRSHIEQGKKLLKKAERLLGKGDATCEMLRKSTALNERNLNDLKGMIKKSETIGRFEPIKLTQDQQKEEPDSSL